MWGWITVGTQAGSHAIDIALQTEHAHLALSPHPHPIEKSEKAKSFEDAITAEDKEGLNLSSGRNDRGTCVSHPRSPCFALEVQQGFLVADDGSGLTPQPNIASPCNGYETTISHFLGARGDEMERGPIFNYARVFTWSHIANEVTKALRTTVTHIRASEPCQQHTMHRATVSSNSFSDSTSVPSDSETDPSSPWVRFLDGTSVHTERYCGIDSSPIWAYPEWTEIPLEVWKGIFVASFVAIFVQWGTSGSALIIAYLTPVRGIGCRSGSHLLYGVMGTAAWWCMAVSALLSHAWLLGLQRKEQKHEGRSKVLDTLGRIIGSRKDKPNTRDEEVEFENQRGSPHSPLESNFYTSIRFAAAMLRYWGKFLAVFNAIWLLISNLLEYANAFDNCFCQSVVISLGDGAWILLFKTSEDLEVTALTPWATGVTISIIVCIFAYGFFALGVKDIEVGE